MKSRRIRKGILFVLMSVFTLSSFAQTPVEKHGQLSVDGKHIVDQNGDVVQLKGMSLFWSNWAGEFYNYDVLKTLRDEWKCSIFRAPMGIVGNDEGAGYLDAPDVEQAKMETVIKAAIDLGLYVIVDWHSHDAHTKEQTKAAKQFFDLIASKYGDQPNVLYEIYNEPTNVSWDSVVKPYHEAIIPNIRKHDKNNIILCGTPVWAQNVDVAAENPIDDDNVAYVVHYYAATHKQYLRDKCDVAMNKGLAIFISEFGVCNHLGQDPIDVPSTNEWFEYLDENKISWCNWSIHYKKEAASALKPGASSKGGWTKDDLTESGTLIYNELTK